MAKNSYLSGPPMICELLSFIPRHLADESVAAHQSDRYYKTMTAYKQLAFLFYDAVMRCKSLNNLCKGLLLLEDKIACLGIGELPAASALSDANIYRNSDVLAPLCQKLYQYHKGTLRPSLCHFKEQLDSENIFCFDSSAITLFVDIFKGAGRSTLTGKKKRGLQLHAKVPLMGFVTDLAALSEAACNDKMFPGQLEAEKGAICLFDKGHASYQGWKDQGEKGASYMARLNENASYEALAGQPNAITEYADGDIISDQRMLLKDGLEARLIVHKDHVSGKVLQLFDQAKEGSFQKSPKNTL